MSTSHALQESYEAPVTDTFSSLHDELIRITPSHYLQGSGVTIRLFALLLLGIALPVIGTLVVLVRLSSRGPGFYRQVRVGKDGRIFVMYKLRSMVLDAEAGTGPVWTQDVNDPRITRIGRFIRATHLDELPQLLNVVRGEMALFGPRPERPELVRVLSDNIPDYFDRLAVLPGITGLAQINLPPDTDIDSVRTKLVLDLEYVRDATFGLELRMFVWTVMRLVGVPASKATALMGLSRNVRPVENTSTGPVTIDDIRENVR